MSFERFHPLVASWFESKFKEPSEPQTQGWEHIAQGRDTLIAAPTGSGKTLAAFAWWIDALIRKAAAGELTDETSLIYVSPLKALGNDIQKNLQEPLAEIRALAEERGAEMPEIRVAVRSGDTPQSERALMIRRPPHILITTPESLYILLTAERSRNFMSTAGAVVIDEIHAIAGDKRGSHLALSMERLDALCGRRLQRIGLSATIKPIEDVARLLIGAGRDLPGGGPDCAIVDVGHRREWDLSIETPSQPLGAIATNEMRAEILDRIVELAKTHRTTLVFVNTRRLVERLAHELTERMGPGKVAAHHGSLSRKIRLQAEHGLKTGEVPVVVATASLELGIDIGSVDLVCHFGAPRAIATLLQRVGRSGHRLGEIPKGILFPLTRDELLQCAAAVRAARSGELDRVIMPEKPLDILAQQIVATAASSEVGIEEMWEMARRTKPYVSLTRGEFEQVLDMLAEGVAPSKGRRSARVHRDTTAAVLRGRRGSRLAAITSGGAIPDVADYDVVEEPAETFVGKVNEDFAIESSAGDIFLLGNTSWRIRRVESGKVRVEDAHGAPPTIPFWTGEAPARTAELSEAVSRLRREVVDRMDDPAAVQWLMEETAVDAPGAEQVIEYLRETIEVLGLIPTQERIVAERFFDESGGMQLVIHSPFGARINRAWGLSLRKRFCVTFDFELQAAATDDGIVLSLGEQHSFPLESVFSFVKTPTVRDALVQALLASPMFTARWRWNSTRSLALLRHTGGRKVPMPILRMRADDLLAAVFPEQVQCQDNRAGDLVPPDHPLVNETILNCLHEAMDLDGCKEIIGRIERGELETVSIETPSPSPMSHEILNANPYAFLDDAPLEERRARAVALRRTTPDLAEGVGALSSAAIDEVASQSWPDVRGPDELHDHLLTLGILPVEEASEWQEHADSLIAGKRAVVTRWTDEGGSTRSAYLAVERQALIEGDRVPVEQDAVRAIVQGWMECIGIVTAEGLSRRLGIPQAAVEYALLQLEGSGVVLRGRFTGSKNSATEWCDRRLLARIHRLTIQTLRREIEPVSAADFIRFLTRWQHVFAGTQLHGTDGVVGILRQLQGFELPAPAWESHVLPARLARYDPSALERLCLAGEVTWGRLSLYSENDIDEAEMDQPPRVRSHPTRNTPLSFVLREDLHLFVSHGSHPGNGLGHAGREVETYLAERGASFISDIAKGTGRLPAEVEAALWELVSHGLVTGDGVAGLRSLLNPPRPNPRRFRALAGGKPSGRRLPTGRWSLWRPEGTDDPSERERGLAKQLLRRYGVVFRDLIARERNAPPWRVLLRVLRRLEAAGEIRGGRFVSGFVGEQFALPEAVETLRAVRRKKGESELVVISAADPLNLAGIIVPGPRISPLSNLAIAYRGGEILEAAALGTLRSRLRAEGQRV